MLNSIVKLLCFIRNNTIPGKENCLNFPFSLEALLANHKSEEKKPNMHKQWGKAEM